MKSPRRWKRPTAPTARKAPAPRTEQGKSNSCQNALKHGLDSREPPWIKALDEDSTQYRRFCRRLVDTFQVRDAVQDLLAGDMARTRWRLERVLRAESAYLAYRRSTLDNEQRGELAAEDVNIRTAFDQIIVGKAGYKALLDSEAKFQLILLLAALRAEAETEGYTETGTRCLELVYGPNRGVATQNFFHRYKDLKPEEGRSAAEQEHLRQVFLVHLEWEVERFKAMRECMRQKRGVLFDMQKDTKLLLSTKVGKRVASEETRLLKYFYQAMNQLMVWRERAARDGPPAGFSLAGGGGPAAILPDETPAPPSAAADRAEEAAGADLQEAERRSALRPGAGNEHSTEETTRPATQELPERLRPGG